MAKKLAAPKKGGDELTALAGLGVELAVISDRVDALAARAAAAEKRLDDAKLRIADLSARLTAIETKPAVARKWWPFW